MPPDRVEAFQTSLGTGVVCAVYPALETPGNYQASPRDAPAAADRGRHRDPDRRH